MATELTGRRLLAALGFAAIGAIVAWWTLRALGDPRAWDFNPAYYAGKTAWATGHPEVRKLWDGTPLLATCMAFVSQVMSIRAASASITVLNALLVIGIVAVALWRLREQLPRGWWWVSGFALVSFGPMMSTVWWKQFNIIAFAFSLAGIELLERGRTRAGAGAIGLSVAVKPLLVLLPFVLLARRTTRRAGARALGWMIALSVAGEAFLAVRAGDLGVLDPVRALQNFSDKTKPANGWACKTLNFAPGSLLCRIAGDQQWTLQRIVVLIAVAALGAWVVAVLRGRRLTTWEVFAFTCPLSVMFSPLDWAHYQVLLAPLMMLLLVRFLQDGAGAGYWLGLLLAFVLASLVWEPYGSLPGAVRQIVSGHHETGADLKMVDWISEFGQYILLVTGVLWYRGHPPVHRPVLARRKRAVAFGGGG